MTSYRNVTTRSDTGLDSRLVSAHIGALPASHGEGRRLLRRRWMSQGGDGVRRRLVMIAAGAALALGLAACGGSGAGGGAGAGGSAPASQAPADTLVGVSMPTKSSERWIADGNAVKRSSRRRATRSACSTRTTTSRRRSRRSSKMITKGAEGPDHRRHRRHGDRSQLQAAADQNIPVIAYDRLIRGSAERRLLRHVRQLPGRRRSRPTRSSTGSASRTTDGSKGPPPARSTSSCSPARSTTTTRSSSSTARWTILQPLIETARWWSSRGQTNIEQAAILRWERRRRRSAWRTC